METYEVLSDIKTILYVKTALELFKEMKKERQLSSSAYKEAIKLLDHRLANVNFQD